MLENTTNLTDKIDVPVEYEFIASASFHRGINKGAPTSIFVNFKSDLIPPTDSGRDSGILVDDIVMELEKIREIKAVKFLNLKALSIDFVTGSSISKLLEEIEGKFVEMKKRSYH